MNANRIVAARVRGRYQGSHGAIREAILEPLFEQLRKISENRTNARELRDWAFLTAAKIRPIMGTSLGNTTENDLMKLIFTATTIANLAQNASSSPLTDLAVALHTADPGEAGDQTTSESAYTSYARVNVVRTAVGWTVTNNSVSPAANIDFPAGTGGSGTVTHASVGFTGGGATKILFSGTVTPNIVTGNGVTPRLTTSSTFTID